jgi:hypothetical protein
LGGFEFRALRLQLLPGQLQTLISPVQLFFKKPHLTSPIARSAATNHPAEDEASNDSGQHTGNEQKNRSHRNQSSSISLIPSIESVFPQAGD